MVLVIFGSACTSIDPNATGPEVYEQACSRCHGADFQGGGGMPALGPGSEAAAKPDESLLATITNGRARMPSFGNQLTDAQIDGLVVYLREVQGAE